MEPFPPVPPVEEAPGLLQGGHLWVLEAVAGGPVRFRLREDGRVDVGDDERRFAGDVPPAYAATVRWIRERLDRAALRGAVGEPSAVTFLGVATYRRGIDYDFDRIPPFLGREVHDGDGFLDPGAVAGIYDRLGLSAVPAVDKEVRAVDFDPGRFEVPDSAYRDGPAPGVVLRDKTGDRGRIDGPDVAGTRPTLEGDPEDLADRLVTDRRVERAREGAGGEFEGVFERTLERIDREETDRLPDVDRRAFRSAVASAVRRKLE